MASSELLVPLGVIVGAHGVRGELRVKRYNPRSDLLLELDAAILRRAGERHRKVALRSVRRHGEGILLVLDDCTDRDAALALRGAELCVTRAELPAPEPGEHYLIDLIGLEARLANGDVLGTVSETIDYPASQVLLVQTERGAIEVPLVERFVIELRVDEGVVIVDHVEELDVQPAKAKGAREPARED